MVPDRLLDSIIDDALAADVARLNGFLPESVTIDITSVDLTAIRGQLNTYVADRLNEMGVPVNPNDPVISAILARYAETLNGHVKEMRFSSKPTSGAVRTIPVFAQDMPSTTTGCSRSLLLPAGIPARPRTADARPNRSLIPGKLLRERSATS